MGKNIKIHKLILGEIKENCYIIEIDGNAIIIDPGQNPQKIGRFLKDNCLIPKIILLTHAHYDHAYSVKYLQKKGAKCYVHAADAEKLEGNGIMEEFFEKPFPRTKTDDLLSEKEYDFFGLNIKVLHTPGHTSGSCCFIIENELFSGDTLFDNGYGRCDLVDGDFNKMKQSLRKLKPYYRLPRHPGHSY